MENFNKESTSQQPYWNPENRAAGASSSPETAARMKLADKAADMKHRVSAAKPWTNSTIPAKQLQALSTPQPQLSILAAIKISGAAHSAANKIHATANCVRQINVKGWWMTLRIF
jgi:hypothetical protein